VSENSERKISVEIDEPIVVEGVFFRQGIKALEQSAYDDAIAAFERLSHSRHYGPHYFLGVALLRSKKNPVEIALLRMMHGLEMMLDKCDGDLKNTDPTILFSFTEEIHEAVNSGQLSWKNEEFDLDGSFDELQTLVQEVKAQLEKDKLDDALITELCCAVLELFESARPTET
jgi:hypothetical protein